MAGECKFSITKSPHWQRSRDFRLSWTERAAPAVADQHTIHRLRLFVIVLGCALECAIFLLGAGWFFAKQDLSTHYNLYYLMWKAGIRRYEASVVLAGMFHDNRFQESLKGGTLQDFESRFPSTFHEVRKLPPIAKENQRFFIDSYEQSIRGSFGMVWTAVFENDKLIELRFSK
jgi:hypothetical protein